jgi:hypothetical protein
MGTRALSLGIKWLGREVDHSPPSTAEVKKWVELYLHFPNTPSWRGAQLKEALGKLYIFLVLYITIWSQVIQAVLAQVYLQLLNNGSGYSLETACVEVLRASVSAFGPASRTYRNVAPPEYPLSTFLKRSDHSINTLIAFVIRALWISVA